MTISLIPPTVTASAPGSRVATTRSPQRRRSVAPVAGPAAFTAASAERLRVGPPPIPQAARDLIADAGRALGRAIRADDPADRYVAAHLAALRSAAALLSVRPRGVRPPRQASAWVLLAKAAPEFAEWAAFFAAGASKRQAAEAGIARSIGAREADDLVRQASAFLDLIEARLTSDAGP